MGSEETSATARALGRALAGLYARVPLGMRLGLDPMKKACAEAGHPERAFEVLHIAGTNGKGSTSAMSEAIARAAGKRTGLYTSPHLVRFAERIRVAGEPLDDATLAATLDEALVRGPDLSFFETATLAAFLAFRAAKVEVAVLEVGIGGRLDATNVVPPPRAAAITSIALDHTDRLGTTLVEIAREKAGILKPGTLAFRGPMPLEAARAIDEVAARVGAKVEDAPPREVHPALLGDHQIGNARVAFALGRALGASDAACEAGIASTRWPGRLETVTTPDGPVLLDAAHNPEGAEALARYLEAHGPGPSRTTIVFGALADKAWAESLDRLAPLAARRVYVRPLPTSSGASTFPRNAIDPAALAARHPGEVAASVDEALARARASAPELLVVTGSIYLVGHARGHLLGLPADPPVAL